MAELIAEVYCKAGRGIYLQNPVLFQCGASCHFLPVLHVTTHFLLCLGEVVHILPKLPEVPLNMGTKGMMMSEDEASMHALGTFSLLISILFTTVPAPHSIQICLLRQKCGYPCHTYFLAALG